MSVQKMVRKSVAWSCLGGVLLSFSAGAQQASQGIRLLDDKLTISPAVDIGVMYDSNIIFNHTDTGDFIYRVNPSLNMKYVGTDWGMMGNAWYAHNWYDKYDVKDNHRWGETYGISYDSPKGVRGFLRESYIESDQNDSWSLNDGDGIWRNRMQFDVVGGISYDLSERLSATLHGMYSDIWYENDSNAYYPLYGWKQWSLGGELAHKLTERSAVLLSASYQEYFTDGKDYLNRFDNTSYGYSLMGGVMSRATERIRYRALLGATMYDYAGTQSYAPSYMLDATWMISSKLAATVAGASYFQPSERDYTQRRTVYTISGGLTYSPVKRVRLTLDGLYRGDENETVKEYSSAVDYSRNQYTVRLRASYQLQKYVSVYCAGEYTYQDSNRMVQDQWDRYLISVGMSLRY